MEPDADIREQMEAIQRGLRRSGREMVLPGTQALVRGLFVLVGCAGTYYLMGHPWWHTALLWALILSLTILVEATLYLRLLARYPDKFVTGVERQMLKFFALIIAFGVIFSAALVMHNRSERIPGLWMLLIGMAYVATGLFSFSDTWIFGIFVCAGGALALFVIPTHALTIMGLTLGLGSIVWALVVRLRGRRSD